MSIAGITKVLSFLDRLVLFLFYSDPESSVVESTRHISCHPHCHESSELRSIFIDMTNVCYRWPTTKVKRPSTDFTGELCIEIA